MKILSSILLVYILLMAVAPGFEFSVLADMETVCCTDDCSDEGGDTKKHESSDCGVCNPLFSCSCYCGFIVNHHTFELRRIKSTESKKAIYYLSSPIQLSYSIWQPPKLAA